jgi:hypothetical protein
MLGAAALRARLCRGCLAACAPVTKCGGRVGWETCTRASGKHMVLVNAVILTQRQLVACGLCVLLGARRRHSPCMGRV